MDWKIGVTVAAAMVVIIGAAFGASSWIGERLRSLLHPLPEGAMLAINSDTGIPAGWQLCKGVAGRFLLGTDKAGEGGTLAEYAPATAADAIEWASRGTADQGQGLDLSHAHKTALPVIRVQFICKE